MNYEKIYINIQSQTVKYKKFITFRIILKKLID